MKNRTVHERASGAGGGIECPRRAMDGMGDGNPNLMATGGGGRSPGRRCRKVGARRRRQILLIHRDRVGDPFTPSRERRGTLLHCGNAAPPLRRRHPFVNRIGSGDPKGAAHRMEALVLFPLLEVEEERVFHVLVAVVAVVVVGGKVDVLLVVVFKLGSGVGIRIGLEVVIIVAWSRVWRGKMRGKRARVEVGVQDGEGRKGGEGERTGERNDWEVERVVRVLI